MRSFFLLARLLFEGGRADGGRAGGRMAAGPSTPHPHPLPLFHQLNLAISGRANLQRKFTFDNNKIFKSTFPQLLESLHRM